MTEARMLYLGGVLVDLVYQIDRLPDVGTEVTAETADTLVGGGYNTMIAALRNGLPVAYGGAHGSGRYGDEIRRTLDDAGIEVLQDIAKDGDNGTCVVLVTADGERSFITYAGIESQMTDERLAGVAPRPNDRLVLSGYALCRNGSDEAVLRWLSRLPPETLFLFDPSPLIADIPRASREAILQRCSWLSCNAREAQTLTGEADPARAIAALQARPDLRELGILLRLGGDGCLLAPAGGAITEIPAFPIVPLDSTGAGDAHVGTFVAALSQGADPREAALRANAAGAVVVTRFGGATAPTADEIDAYLTNNQTVAGPAMATASSGHR